MDTGGLGDITGEELHRSKLRADSELKYQLIKLDRKTREVSR